MKIWQVLFCPIFPSKDRKHIADAIDACADAVIDAVDSGIDKSMNFIITTFIEVKIEFFNQ